MKFHLGTCKPHWLRLTDAPLFVSRRSLSLYRTPPRALGPWALDSGGFSELSLYGEWRTSAVQYASEVRYWHDAVGGLQWAAAQDWMCEPAILEKTRLSVREHQRLTLHNYLLLRRLAPDMPFVPVLQGYEADEYLRHVDDYAAAGVDLAALPLVGLGSVCRRQATGGIEGLCARLWTLGIRLHAFGMKLNGLARVARYLASSDSMAWSFDARHSPPLPGCTHRSCANCIRYALSWRQKVLRVASLDCARPRQPAFL